VDISIYLIFKRLIDLMSRRKVAKKRPVAPDPVYQSRLVSLLVSHLLKKGKKSLAYRIFYEAMTQISETTSQDPLEVLRQAVLNITPKVEVKSRLLVVQFFRYLLK